MAELRKRVWLALLGVAVLVAAGYTSPLAAPPAETPLAPWLGPLAANAVPAPAGHAEPGPTGPAEPGPNAGGPAAAGSAGAGPGPAGAVPADGTRPLPPPAAGTAGAAAGIGSIVAGLRGAPGVVAAIVFDRAAGRIVLAEQPDRRFQSASLVKLLIVLDLLAAGPVDEPTAGRLRSMLAASDDAVASDFWVAGGRGAIVRRMASALQLAAIPPPSESTWGHTGISAGDILAVYRHILDRLAPPDRDLIMSALRAAPRIAADGYDQYFGLPDGLPGLPRAIKQGWSSGQGVVAVHSTGVLGAGDRFVVILMTEHPSRVGWRTAMRLATSTAGLLAPLLSPPPGRT